VKTRRVGPESASSGSGSPDPDQQARPQDDPRLRRPVSRRQVILLSSVAGALVLGLVGGWLLSGLFTSPAQHDANASPPPAGPIVAEVGHGDLADTVSFDVSISRENHQVVPLTPAQGVSVVTNQPQSPGAEVAAGSVVLEVNGRPVFAMPGSFPFYRNLMPGDQGPDVLQLQQGLVAAGIPVNADGRFGSGTVSAVRTLYRNAGYTTASTASQSPDGQATSVLSIPAAELAVVAALPAFLSTSPGISTPIGEDSSLTFDQGKLVGVGAVPVGVVARLQTELDAVIRAGTSDVESVISSIGEVDEESGLATVIVVPTGEGLADDQIGQSLVAVVTVSLAATNSLIVPSIAVSPQGGADPIVLKQTPTGFVEVKVREVAQLSGQSAVEPLDGNALKEGDFVRVN